MLLRAIVLAVLLALGSNPAMAAETSLADPKPSPDNPRKILLQLTSKDPRTINNLLFNVVNIQKFYAMDNVRIAVVAYADGMQAFYRKTSPVNDRIASLLLYDVEFVACGNTMQATGHKAAELIEGVEMVTAGIPEIVERTLRGWHYIRP